MGLFPKVRIWQRKAGANNASEVTKQNAIPVDSVISATPFGAHGEQAIADAATYTLARPADAGGVSPRAVMVQATTDLRYRLDGTNPDADTGFVLSSGDLLLLEPAAEQGVRFRNGSGGGSVLQYQWIS